MSFWLVNYVCPPFQAIQPERPISPSRHIVDAHLSAESVICIADTYTVFKLFQSRLRRESVEQPVQSYPQFGPEKIQRVLSLDTYCFNMFHGTLRPIRPLQRRELPDSQANASFPVSSSASVPKALCHQTMSHSLSILVPSCTKVYQVNHPSHPSLPSTPGKEVRFSSPIETVIEGTITCQIFSAGKEKASRKAEPSGRLPRLEWFQ